MWVNVILLELLEWNVVVVVVVVDDYKGGERWFNRFVV